MAFSMMGGGRGHVGIKTLFVCWLIVICRQGSGASVHRGCVGLPLTGARLKKERTTLERR